MSPPGADDWFLPSMGELYLMYTNLRQALLDGVSSAEFVEYSSDKAWYQNFGNGELNKNQIKHDALPSA
ncbi:MAG: hypothetical protein ACKN9W_11525 [Methylococcus sp.]